MVFDENSALVQIWVRLVRAGAYTEQQVPPLANLRQMVAECLGE